MATRIDARRLDPGTELRADVAIIGAGPAGITVARQLAGTGLDVVVLESGGEQPHPETAALAAGHSVGYPYHPLERSRLRGFGGTSEHWELDLAAGDNGWFARPMDPVDFEARPGIPHSGWPIGYDDLLPYYERAQPAAGLGRFRYAPSGFPTDETAVIQAPGVATPVFQFGPTNFTGHLPELEAAPNVRVLLHATVREVGL